MKVNKLKAFFIVAFIALILPLSIGLGGNLSSSAISPAEVTYPPTLAGVSYMQYYNYIEQKEIEYLTAYEHKSRYYIIFCDAENTYIATFDKEGYKRSEDVLINDKCVSAVYFENNIILISNKSIYTLNVSLEVIDTQENTTCYKVTIIDNNLLYLYRGEENIAKENNIIYISSPYDFVNMINNYYIFENGKELYITDFEDCLCFEVDSFVGGKTFGNALIFGVTIGDNTIVTLIDTWEIMFSCPIEVMATNIHFTMLENGIDVYITGDATYKYFLCNHGDIISYSLFSNEKLLDLENKVFENDDKIIINYVETLPKDFYFSILFRSESFIFFTSSDSFNQDKNIYFGKLR